jgi:PDZ domain-containing secreted protein
MRKKNLNRNKKKIRIIIIIIIIKIINSSLTISFYSYYPGFVFYSIQFQSIIHTQSNMTEKSYHQQTHTHTHTHKTHRWKKYIYLSVFSHYYSFNQSINQHCKSIFKFFHIKRRLVCFPPHSLYLSFSPSLLLCHVSISYTI